MAGTAPAKSGAGRQAARQAARRATGLRVLQERHKRGWSQTQLAALTGIAQSDISAIEQGRFRPGRNRRDRIALAFGLPEKDLFDV